MTLFPTQIFEMEKWYKEETTKIQHEKELKWHYRFLKHAESIASWSKDPSRKVGAVIVNSKNEVVSQGYNGFARGVNDDSKRYEDRSIKYELVVHAEVNAIITAKRDLVDCTIYTTLLPCSRCAAIIINSGIKRVVTYESEHNSNDIAHSFDLTRIQFQEAFVRLIELPKIKIDKSDVS